MQAKRKAIVLTAALMMAPQATSVMAGETAPRGHLRGLLPASFLTELVPTGHLTEVPLRQISRVSFRPLPVRPANSDRASRKRETTSSASALPRLLKGGEGGRGITRLADVRKPVATAQAASTTKTTATKQAAAKAAQGKPDEGEGRYVLKAIDGDLTRLDLKTGVLDVCKKAGAIWRCLPMPSARDAYEDEISSLTNEVGKLQARVRDLEQSLAKAPANDDLQDKAPVTGELKLHQKPTPSPTDRLSSLRPQAAEPEAGSSKNPGRITPPAPAEKADRVPDAGGSKAPSENAAGLQPQQTPDATPGEHAGALEGVTQFSSRAVRRFFGLVDDMRKEFTGPSPDEGGK